MINWKLVTGILGNIGTAAVLLVACLGYFIWQFNPAFNFRPKRQENADAEDDETWQELSNLYWLAKRSMIFT